MLHHWKSPQLTGIFCCRCAVHVDHRSLGFILKEEGMKCNDVDKIKPLDKLLDEKVKEFESGEDKKRACPGIHIDRYSKVVVPLREC